MADEFEQAVGAWCRRERILGRGARVLAAVSGGPDSLALLYCLAALAPGEKWRLAVGHLDHGLRAASARDAEFVRRHARMLGLPFFGARVDVAAITAAAGRSAEDGARVARRSFLARAAAAFGADAVALGHTADDQAETVILNILRGAGTLGLAAMPPVTGLWVRPLLARRRPEVIAYLTRRGLSWREDASNRDLSLRRNWVRHRLLPELEGPFPNVRSSLAALADLARAEEKVWEEQTAALLRPFVVSASSREVRLAAAFPAALPEALRGRAVRQLFRRLVGSAHGLERRHVAAALALAEGSAVCLPAGVRVSRPAGAVVFARESRGPKLEAWAATLTLPGRLQLPPLDIAATATPARAPATLRGRGVTEVWLDPALGGESLTVRSWAAGDYIRPLGLGGRKKIQDLFGDAKVAPPARRRWPVFTRGGDVVWVPALALAEGVAAAPGAAAIHVRCSWPGGPAVMRNGDRERVTYGL